LPRPRDGPAREARQETLSNSSKASPGYQGRSP
jgi:hypothetical protein